MSERSYTVSEIIRMRRSVTELLSVPLTPFRASERKAEVEDQLRTYMTAGIDPDDLEAAALDHQRMQLRMFQEMNDRQAHFSGGGGIGT